MLFDPPLAKLSCSIALASVLVAGSATAQQPPPPAGAQPAQAQPQPPPPGYGPPPPGYAPPPPGYGPPPAGYGQPPPGYYAPGYAPPPGYYYYPPPPAPPPDTRKRFSIPLMVTGIVAAGVGVVLLGIGGTVFSNADNNFDCICPADGGCQCDDHSDRKTTGIVLMVTGGVLAAAGIPMIIVGARKVGEKPGGDRPKPREQEEEAKLAPSLLVGPRAAALRWRF